MNIETTLATILAAANNDFGLGITIGALGMGGIFGPCQLFYKAATEAKLPTRKWVIIGGAIGLVSCVVALLVTIFGFNQKFGSLPTTIAPLVVAPTIAFIFSKLLLKPSKG